MTEPTHEEQVEALRAAISTLEMTACIFPDGIVAGKLPALRAIEAHLEADRWRPIEEAPKDDSWDHPIEGWRPRRGAARIRWEADKYVKKPKPYWASNDAHWVTEDRKDQPTHWRRLSPGPALPAPPCDTRAAKIAKDNRDV